VPVLYDKSTGERQFSIRLSNDENCIFVVQIRGITMPEANKEKDKSSKSTCYGDSLGQMYRRFVLDCISDLGYAVSLDFIYRPELYQDVDPKVAALMGTLQASIDNQPNLPGTQTRAMLYKPIFGTSDATGTGNDGSTYQAGRLQLIASATGFAENAQAVGQPMHRERVRSALVSQNDHFIGFEGESITQSGLRTQEIFDIATKIITGDAIRVVFGINKEIDPKWPLESNDSQGAKLVEKITQQLQEGVPAGAISRERFIRLQRIAEKGDAAIKGILDPSVETDDGKLDALISQLYAWGSDLGLIGGRGT
jgi:hypothetical protein